MNWVASLVILAALWTPVAVAQQNAKALGSKRPPRFEDYPVREGWNRPAATVKLLTRSERMFKTKLTEEAKLPPNFAGHYRFAIWGAGSNCAAGAVIDLATGSVHQPPGASPSEKEWDHWMLSCGLMDDSGIDFRVDSRLVVIRGGMNWSQRLEKNFPDSSYYLWDDSKFRAIFEIDGAELMKQAEHLASRAK